MSYKFKTIPAVLFSALLLFATAALAAELVHVGRIQSDVTLLNKEVLVRGAVTQVQTDGGNISWGRFLLRDSYDGESIMVQSDHLPAPSSEPQEFLVLVQKDGGRVFLKHLTDAGGGLEAKKILTDPLYIIGFIFLLVMIALLYYLFKPEKPAVEEPSPTPYLQPESAVQSSHVVERSLSQEPAPAAPDETLDLFGYLTVLECMNTDIKGSRIPVTVKESGSTLARGGDINIADKSFSSTSAKIWPNGGDALLMENVSRKYPLYVTSSSGHRSTLNFGDKIELANGDIIEQENSALKLEFFGTGDKTVDI